MTSKGWDCYFSVGSLDDAVRLIAERPGIRRVVAGATDLILELQRGLHPQLRELVDISRVPQQDRIVLAEDGWLHLGPLVTHNQCAASTLLVERAFALAQACWEVGAPQIRNRGTVCGNLVTGSPANDAIPPLMALGAVLSLRSPSGERQVPLEDFYRGVRRTNLAPDEVVVDIAFPLPPPRSRSAFIKLGLRRAQAVSVASVAVALDLEGADVRSAAIALGSVAPTVIRARQAETFLIGRTLTQASIERASRLAAEEARPIDDLRGSADYRRDMVRVCTDRALSALLTGDERRGFPDRPVMLLGRPGDSIVRPPQTLQTHRPGDPIETNINGVPRTLASHATTLLQLIRDEAGLTGTKEGCDEGECGACTVYLDGAAVMACLVPAPRAHGAQICTVEGLARPDALHPIQESFIDEAAVQCGYCTPGVLMAGAKLLEERPHPTRADISHAIAGNLCRCTGYFAIVAAIERAAALAGASPILAPTSGDKVQP